MQHFTTLGNAAYKFFKTFRANPVWAKCVGPDRGGGLNIFAKIDSTLRVTTGTQADIILNESNIDNMNYLWKLTINTSENVLLFTKY